MKKPKANIQVLLRYLRQRLDRLMEQPPATVPTDKLGSKSILEQYVLAYPGPQNALDIFKGEWSSQMPVPLAELRAGANKLFDDDRIKWFASEVGGLRGKTVLELGPLEGGHTYMLERFGASSIISIEANTRAFLKCLISKELHKLQHVQFLCGDFVEYLDVEEGTFDVCLASGVLYHQQNPVELIALLSKHCTGHLLLWTHYYDHDVVQHTPILTRKFSESQTREHLGFRHTLHQYNYQDALDWAGFCGGHSAHSYWMERDELIRCLKHFGFENLRISFDQPDHINGPALAIVADKAHEKSH